MSRCWALWNIAIQRYWRVSQQCGRVAKNPGPFRTIELVMKFWERSVTNAGESPSSAAILQPARLWDLAGKWARIRLDGKNPVHPGAEEMFKPEKRRGESWNDGGKNARNASDGIVRNRKEFWLKEQAGILVETDRARARGRKNEREK